MFNTGMAFTFNIICLYSGYKVLVSYNEKLFRVTTVYILWSCYYDFYIFGLIYFGSKMSAEVSPKHIVLLKIYIRIFQSKKAKSTADVVNKVISQSKGIDSKVIEKVCGTFHRYFEVFFLLNYSCEYFRFN